MVVVNSSNKAKILASLYNASKPQGLGLIQYDPEPMTEEEAEILIEDNSTYYFDYLKGRVMKVQLLPGKEIDFFLYDRDNGPGAGFKATRGL